ncbi:MAG: hypothetical protein AAGA66_17910 [Bacteroidota bacterium]
MKTYFLPSKMRQTKEVLPQGIGCGGRSTATLMDNRPSTLFQRQLRETINTRRTIQCSHRRSPDRPSPSISVSGQVVQCHGEEEALEAVKKTGIRRGNRRSSILDTKGGSSSKIGVMREVTNIVIKALKNQRKNKPPVGALASNKNIIAAYVSQLVKVGNCEEFSQIIFTYLIEHTTGQWVYLMNVSGEDDELGMHAFVMTSPAKIATEGTAFRQDDELLSHAQVVDGWYLYKKMPFPTYMNGGNHFHKKLNVSDLTIVDSIQATKSGSTLKQEEMVYIDMLVDAHFRINENNIERIRKATYKIAKDDSNNQYRLLEE